MCAGGGGADGRGAGCGRGPGGYQPQLQDIGTRAPDGYQPQLRTQPDSAGAAAHPDSQAVRPGVVVQAEPSTSSGFSFSWVSGAVGAIGGGLIALLAPGASAMRERRRLVSADAKSTGDADMSGVRPRACPFQAGEEGGRGEGAAAQLMRRSRPARSARAAGP